MRERYKIFTGIILLPGSFSGRMSSPRPQRGPLDNETNVKTSKVKQYKMRVMVNKVKYIPS